MIIIILTIIYFVLFGESSFKEQNPNIIKAKYISNIINQNIKLFNNKNINYLDLIDTMKIDDKLIEKTNNYTFRFIGNYFIIVPI